MVLEICMFMIIAYLSSFSNPKDYKCKKVKKDENASYFGECVFDVHLNENFRNVRESFSWSFDWENVSFFLWRFI